MNGTCRPLSNPPCAVPKDSVRRSVFAVCCSVLQCVLQCVLHCVLQCIAVCGAVRCNMIQCVAVCLQCVAVSESALLIAPKSESKMVGI